VPTRLAEGRGYVGPRFRSFPSDGTIKPLRHLLLRWWRSALSARRINFQSLTVEQYLGVAITCLTLILVLRTIAAYTGLFSQDSSDGVHGLLTSDVAGAAAALALAVGLTVYLRRRHRGVSDIVRDGLAAAAVLGLLAFVASDMGAALAYLGINSTPPTVEFEIRLPNTAISAVSQSQVELHADGNQRLAQLQGILSSEEDGRIVLRGLVSLDYRTRDRLLILRLPDHVECEFKVRLPATPSRSDQFGPWHLADRLALASKGEQTASQQNDAFAIRYRVL
jgi:hypothetical protein